MSKCSYEIVEDIENIERICNRNKASKRVSWVSIKMVREKSVLYKNRSINSPQDAVTLVRDTLEVADKEKLIVCSLDTKNQPTSLEIVSVGSLNSSLVHPREVFKASILSNSNALIVFHNHPSGDTNPSKEDVNITKRLKECGQILGIELLDHIIIGDGKFCSLKERGII